MPGLRRAFQPRLHPFWLDDRAIALTLNATTAGAVRAITKLVSAEIFLGVGLRIRSAVVVRAGRHAVAGDAGGFGLPEHEGCVHGAGGEGECCEVVSDV